MIFGVNAIKSAVIIAETKGAGKKFSVTSLRTVPFKVDTGDDLKGLLKNLTTLFDGKGKRAKPILPC